MHLRLLSKIHAVKECDATKASFPFISLAKKIY